MQSRQSLVAFGFRLRPPCIRAARVLPSTPPLFHNIERHFLDGQLGGFRLSGIHLWPRRRRRRSALSSIPCSHYTAFCPKDIISLTRNARSPIMCPWDIIRKGLRNQLLGIKTRCEQRFMFVSQLLTKHVESQLYDLRNSCSAARLFGRQGILRIEGFPGARRTSGADALTADGRRAL